MKPIYREKYPHLFEPFTVGKGSSKVTFKNRVLVGPMFPHIIVDGVGLLNDAGLDFFGTMAEGGFASICIPTEVPRDGGHPRTLIFDDEQLVAFQDVHKVQRIVHAYGCKSSCEIYHPGCCQIIGPGIEPISASDMMWNGHFVRGMNEEDMEDVIQMYVNAARGAKRSGFDTIMLHYGHGWLMNNFLSPLSNKRTDKFGGSVENRCRFPLMVIDRIRKTVDMPIEVRMNGSDRTPGGIDVADAVEQVKIFQEYVDMIHITCGTRLDASSRAKMHPTSYMQPAHNVDATEEIKKIAKVPIGVIGSVHDPELAERILAKGKADYVLMARQAVADPEWVNKVKELRTEDIRPCLRCDYCLDSGRRGAISEFVTLANDATYNVVCSTNPYFSQGYVKKKMFEKAPKRKKQVVVIGGGIAGLQAAVTAAERGHDVTLYEKNAKCGGQLFFSDYVKFKKEIKAFLSYMVCQAEKAGVKIIYNTEVTPELLSAINPDAVVVAVGAKQIVPQIEGLNNTNVVMAMDVFGNETQLGKKIVIVGGGLVGCELSIHLAEGHDITVLEMGQYLCANAQLTERTHTLELMDTNNVKSFTQTKVNKITDKNVYAVDVNGQETFFEADSVIICAGTTPLAEERDSFSDVVFEVINVGDCVNASDICHAVTTGFDAGLVL